MTSAILLPALSDEKWNEVGKPEKFRSFFWTRLILEGLSVYKPGTHEVDEERRKLVVAILKRHVPKCIERLRTLGAQLRASFVDKDEIIKMVIVAAIAQQPMLLVGPPGTAKSKIITRFCEGLGIDRVGEDPTADAQIDTARMTCFQYLLHGFTEPEEVLGMLNLAMLKDEVHPRFERFRKGSIIDSEVIFLDEVFKANSAILNALLSIVNERRLYEGGIAHPAKARFIFGASNSIPSPRHMEELQAFYERFIIRMESSTVSVGVNDGKIPPQRELLLKYGWQSEVRDLRGGYDPKDSAIEPVACLNDLLFCNRAVTELWGGENLDTTWEDPDPSANRPKISTLKPFLKQFHDLAILLARIEPPVCSLDDRKFIRLFLLARAHGLYRELGPPKVDDLSVMQHIWNDPTNKDALFNSVKQFVEGHGGKLT